MSLLPPPSNTRLVTIVAHVDHGKTTLADSLVEHNGIISERLAGTMRYLDSMEEEQRRGITIRSSAIGLKHFRTGPLKNAKNKGKEKNKKEDDESNRNMVIHLIDSPGHVDFSMEVSSALQICDGALLIVDVVEGMCARTQSILREAYSQKLVPVLVLNKVDRLCTDLGLSVNEAYVRIRNVIENVNAAASNMIRSSEAQRLDQDYERSRSAQVSNGAADSNDPTNKANGEQANEYEGKDDINLEEIWNFDPITGNVVFATALYGWGFTIPSLARSLFKSKLIPHIKPPILKRYLFGDFKLKEGGDNDGKVLKWKGVNDEMNTMFAEYGLKPIWDIMTGVSTAQTSLGLDSVLFNNDQYSSSRNNSSENKGGKDSEIKLKIRADTIGMVDVVMDALHVGSTNVSTNASSGVPNTTAEMQSVIQKSTQSSEESILRAMLRRHRPLSDAVLDAVCDICPSPSDASGLYRKDALSLISMDRGGSDCEDTAAAENESIEQFQIIQNAVKQCSTLAPAGPLEQSVPTVAHCCKFISTDRAHINDPELFSYLDSQSTDGIIDTNSNDGGGRERNSGIILGVARVLSGALHSKEIEYYCFGPKYKANLNSNIAPKRSIRLYLLMGSTYVRVKQIPAGHICAIHGLEELQFKSVTLSSSPYAMPLQSHSQGIRPLVKVNVEAVSNSDTALLERGLAKLSLADAAVEVTATAKGERILACLGEIHLEQSIIDLRKLYIGDEIDLRISKPIVDFRESTAYFDQEVKATGTGSANAADAFKQFFNLECPPLRQTCMPPYCEEDGLAYARNGRSRPIISGRGMAMHVRVLPLSKMIHYCLSSGIYRSQEGSDTEGDACAEDLRQLGKALNLKEESPSEIFDKLLELIAALDINGNAMIESVGLQSGCCVKGVACRPKEAKEVYVPKASPDDEKNQNESANETKDDKEVANGRKQEGEKTVKTDIAKDEYEDIKRKICGESLEEELSPKEAKTFNIWKSELKGSLIGGFQSGCSSGPLCEEPVRGVLVVLEGVEIALYERRKKTGTEDDFNIAKPITGGMVVAALRTGIRTALLTRPARLMEGHLRLTLHSSLGGLGPLYEVLSRRRGRVLADTMVEGTDLISIEATLPQSESFGLTSELMKKSSGEVTAPELVFSHWDMLEEDPFWIPTSLEEREDYGEIVMNGDISTGVANNALRFIRLVRNRKGLIVDSHKIVVAAEKQRTLARKK